MRHSRWLIPGVISAVIVLICVLVVPHGFIHLFGIDTQQSDNYDFWSGVGPVLVTAIGLSTLIAGAWHHLNCHTDSCVSAGSRLRTAHSRCAASAIARSLGIPAS